MAYVYTQNGTSDIGSGASSGRVGIGTSSPDENLHVYGGHLKLEYSGGDAKILMKNGDNAGSNESALQFDKDTHGLELRVGNTTECDMFIGNDGKVVLGNTAPEEKLDIDGNIQIGSDYHIILKGSSSEPSDGDVPEDGGLIYVFNDSGVIRMKVAVKQGGNVNRAVLVSISS